MKYILIFIIVVFSSNIFSKDFIIDIFGKEEVKTYAIDENNFFRIHKAKMPFRKTFEYIYKNQTL